MTHETRHSRPDLRRGPVTKTLLLFALPMLGGNALQALDSGVNRRLDTTLLLADNGLRQMSIRLRTERPYACNIGPASSTLQ